MNQLNLCWFVITLCYITAVLSQNIEQPKSAVDDEKKNYHYHLTLLKNCVHDQTSYF